MKTFEEILTEVNLLTEVKFYQYSALVQVRYNQDPELHVGAEKLAEILRAVPGATRVSTVSLDRDKGIAVFNVRTISQKSPRECFVSFKRNCLSKFKETIKDIKVAANTIETKNFIQ